MSPPPPSLLFALEYPVPISQTLSVLKSDPSIKTYFKFHYFSEGFMGDYLLFMNIYLVWFVPCIFTEQAFSWIAAHDISMSPVGL